MKRRELVGAVAVAVTVFTGACSDGEPAASGGGDISSAESSADAPAAAGDEPADASGDVEPVDVAALEARATAAAGQVVARSRAFEPATVTIKASEAVAWRFEDGQVPHGVVGDGFDSPPRNQGVFVHTFADAGSYAYRCPVHPAEMQGTIEVR